MTALSLHEISMVFRRGDAACQALAGVSLSLERGQTAALVGTSGSGKTTLLNVAAGLERPTSGRVELLGEPLHGLSQSRLSMLRRRSMGFVFQAFNLLAGMTVWQNVELPLALNDWPRRKRAARVEQLLAAAGLADKARANPMELSAGQQQRVAVLRALAHEPTLVLMDEPTSCLDSRHARELIDLVLDLNRSQGATILLATHDLDLAKRLNTVIRLRDGRVEARPEAVASMA